MERLRWSGMDSMKLLWRFKKSRMMQRCFEMGFAAETDALLPKGPCRVSLLPLHPLYAGGPPNKLLGAR